MKDLNPAQSTAVHLPIGDRHLSALEFQQLARVPAVVGWFANIDNPRTRRAISKNYYTLDLKKHA